MQVVEVPKQPQLDRVVATHGNCRALLSSQAPNAINGTNLDFSTLETGSVRMPVLGILSLRALLIVRRA